TLLGRETPDHDARFTPLEPFLDITTHFVDRPALQVHLLYGREAVPAREELCATRRETHRPRLSRRARHLRSGPAAPRRLDAGALDLQLRATRLKRCRPICRQLTCVLS